MFLSFKIIKHIKLTLLIQAQILVQVPIRSCCQPLCKFIVFLHRRLRTCFLFWWPPHGSLHPRLELASQSEPKIGFWWEAGWRMAMWIWILLNPPGSHPLDYSFTNVSEWSKEVDYHCWGQKWPKPVNLRLFTNVSEWSKEVDYHFFGAKNDQNQWTLD